MDDEPAPGDVSGPGQPARGGLPVQPPQVPAPRRQADMRKTMQAAGGPNIENVIREMDADIGPNPNLIPSERCGGESRRALLKRKASCITRSTAETFAYLTSKTSSIAEAADLLECFGNVSICYHRHIYKTIAYYCIFCIFFLILHINFLTNLAALLCCKRCAISLLTHNVKRYIAGNDA